jgi:hypothetical protein
MTAMLMMITAPSALAAWNCNAGKHCGYNSTGGADRLYQISGPAGSTIHLAEADRDKTTSVRNRTSKFYCGVNIRTFQDETVVEVQPNGQFNLGSIANNVIDHYDVRNNSGNCYNPIF